jgi:hypothetical protein
MKRDYNDGSAENIIYFTGIEVEKTPAYNMPTLFVVGTQDVNEIQTIYDLNNCKHIFFGANHSFKPSMNLPEDIAEWEAWEKMIAYFLKKNIMCSLDIPISYAEEFLETGLVEYENFIPQLRIPIPYVRQWNYNTMIKIDDKDFRASNPGVWCHSLHALLDREKFTDWNKYSSDSKIELTTF